MPPFHCDFSKVTFAIKKHSPRETGAEAYNILEAVYNYFDRLSLETGAKEGPLNFENAKALVYAHFLLNDLLLGTVVGDKNIKKEKVQLELTLQKLGDKASFIVDVQGLWSIIDEGYTSGFDGVIENSRGLLREQLKQLESDANVLVSAESEGKLQNEKK